jgi:hypothetical protein
MMASLVVDSPPPASTAPPYFCVATHKFAAMTICTFGIYEFYWFYKMWKSIRDTTDEKLSPFWRTFFAPIWAFQLFRDIEGRAIAEEVPANWSPGMLAVAYVVAQFLWRLPDPWWLLSMLAFVPMLPVQRAAQAINRRCAPSSDPNARYSAANIIGLVVGGLVLSLVILGLFIAPAAAAQQETTTMHARGPFDVKLTPRTGGAGSVAAPLGHMGLDKQYHGDLDGTAKGEMLTGMGNVKDSGTYVAVEHVTATLGGRRGSFILSHIGTMTRGAQSLSITVVPDSGTDQLAGIAGTMSITIDKDGKHFYDFDYTLPM